MFLRPCRRKRPNGKIDEYWVLVESYRTERGPRQRVVSYLGDLATEVREGVAIAASHKEYQPCLFKSTNPKRVEINLDSLQVESTSSFGGVWLGKYLLDKLGLDKFFSDHLHNGREDIPWAIMAQVLVLGRFLEPSSELRIAEHIYSQTAMADILGVPIDKINDDRLYRALDALLPHKAALNKHLRDKVGELFDIKYDLILYDVTSTYFEGTAVKNSSAKRGYSRDHRSDCLQVCIALVVDHSGFPLGYEIFPGNRHDSTTVKTIVRLMEKIYGNAERIWVMDRGMISEENLKFLRESNRRYIIGTPKAMLKNFERDLLSNDWDTVREGVEVKICENPDGSADRFILCRSKARREKETSMHDRFEKNITEGLEKLELSCKKRKWPSGTIERRVGKLLGANSRAAGLFDVTVTTDDNGRAHISWTHNENWRDWATLSEGCYLLRSNINDLSSVDLWTAYIGLTQAEAAFRIQKSDLQLRPIWHQRLDRVKAHILVCFLAFVLWKTMSQLCIRAGLGDEPRRIIDDLSKIMLVDIAMETTDGITIRKRCIAKPTTRQAILLQHLKITIPTHMENKLFSQNVVKQIDQIKDLLNGNDGKITL
jgi:transposase